MKRILLAIALVATVCLSCSDPKEFVLRGNPKSWSEDEDLRGVLVKLPEEDRTLAVQFMTRSALASAFGVVVPDQKLGEAIENQRAYLAAEEVKKAEAAAKKAAEEAEAEKTKQAVIDAQAQLDKALQIKITAVEPRKIPNRFSVDLEVSISAEWTTRLKQPIKGFKSVLTIKNSLGDTLRRFALDSEEEYPADSHGTLSSGWRLNQFIAEERQIAESDGSKLSGEVQVTMVILADGTKLELPKP